MRKIEDLMAGSGSGIFGPGTDLVVSLAAVLILILALESVFNDEERVVKDNRIRTLEKKVSGLEVDKEKLKRSFILCDEERKIVTGDTDLREVKDHQWETVAAVARQFEVSLGGRLPSEEVRLDIDGDEIGDVFFYNEPTRQRIAFGGNILFAPDEVDLTVGGVDILRKFSRGLLEKIAYIQEIQIEGHADTTQTRAYETNLELGAQRAMTVFRELERNGISPYKTPMSASSFGEYMSVQRFRSANPTGYSRFKLQMDNWTRDQKNLNRRIELSLVYTRRAKNKEIR